MNEIIYSYSKLLTASLNFTNEPLIKRDLIKSIHALNYLYKN